MIARRWLARAWLSAALITCVASVARAESAEGTKPRATAAATTAPASRDGHEWRLGKLRVALVVDVIGQYVLSLRRKDSGELDWFHELELPRGQLGTRVRYDGAEAGVVVEAVRATGGGSLFGVARDSLVMRLRNGYAGYQLFQRLTLRVGVVPTLTTEPLEHSWNMRAVAAIAAERVRLLSPADLGATALVELPRGFGTVAVGGYNGEGYDGRELNRGKNFEASVVIRPLAMAPPVWRPWAVHLSYLGGSSGTARARADRLIGGLSYARREVSAGAAVIYALGLDDDGGRRSLLVDGFARVEPIGGLILAAQAMHWIRNLADKNDALSVITGAAGYRPVKVLEALLCVDHQLAGDSAAPTLPGLDRWRFRAVARFHVE
jgi:hypothetical protein